MIARLDSAGYGERVTTLDVGRMAQFWTDQKLTAKKGLFRRLAAQAGIAV